MKIRFTNNRWLLLDTGAGTASYNMEVDEKLLSLAPEIDLAGVLRFYWFEPAAVTLGYFQKPEAINLAACRQDGIEVARRPTGGRAVFHQEELTYSLILPASNPYFRAGVVASCQGIAEVWQASLLKLGLPAALEKSQSAGGRQTSANCFLSAGRQELKAGDRKLLGSAQVRKNGYLLQHGSIYLRYSPLLASRYLEKTDGAKTEAACLVADLQSLLGREISRSEIKSAVVAGFRERWDVIFNQDLPACLHWLQSVSA